jgi:hypothetical protein
MGIWVNTGFWALGAAVLVSFFVLRIDRDELRRLPWFLIPATSAALWGGFAVVLHLIYWDEYYSHFVPPAMRWLAPMAAVFYFVIAVLLRWLALRLPGNPLANFCLLGGLESVPEHVLGIYKFKILEIPMLQDITALQIFLFAFFEYIVYWSIALGVAFLVGWLIDVRGKLRAWEK